jgi:hypothetical protein
VTPDAPRIRLQTEEEGPLILSILGLVSLQLDVVDPIEIHAANIPDNLFVSPSCNGSTVIENTASALIEAEMRYQSIFEAFGVR